jgi:hypothetical protein
MSTSVEGRLEAIVALLVPIIRALAKSDSAIETAEEKAIQALDRGGVPQTQIARLLGVDNNRVSGLLKKKMRSPSSTVEIEG